MQDQTESWIREAAPAIDSKPVVESKAVLHQLDRMLKSRHFRNSRRYPAFLAHIVRHTLDGDLDSLKERILGVEVFKRPNDYDTGSDPVVRITAGEVRKRIALYYHDEGTERELRIELPPGSYVPVFSASTYSYPLPETAHEPWNGAHRSEPTAALETRDEKSAATLSPKWSQKWLLAGAAALLVVIAALALLFFWTWATSPVESMWRPFFNSPDPVLIVVGTPVLRGDAANRAFPPDSHSYTNMSFKDVLALTDITGLLERHGQQSRVQTADATSLDDLRRRPVILIAAFGNAWSGRILSTLRFSLLRQQIGPDGRTMLGSIIDHRHPETSWNFDFTKPITVNSKDYAIVARLHSDLTEGPVTIIAGLGAAATESAGEFASTPDYLQQINSVAPANWRNKNMELVLEVPMVDGKSGHARIVASEFW